jgi:hypothetical protein
MTLRNETVRERARAVFRHVRAALVAWHVAAIVTAAIPGPSVGVGGAIWRQPSVQAELAAWSARLGTTPARLQAWLVPAATEAFRVRHAVRRPFAPYLAWTGTEQTWQLFSAPDRVPMRFQIAARRGEFAPWETLFEERAAGATWHASYFDHARVRRAVFWYGWLSFAAPEGSHCAWVARQVFRERPDVQVVRCRYYRAPTPSAAQVRAGREPDGQWIPSTTVTRASLSGARP